MTDTPDLPPPDTLVEELKVTDVLEHIRTKEMWAGSLERTTMPDLMGLLRVRDGNGDGDATHHLELSAIDSDHTPALLKSFDEYIVNCADHERQCRKNRKAINRVRSVAVAFDSAGAFMIRNDGPGLSVSRHDAASRAAGRDVFVPEVAFAHPLAGSNIVRTEHSIKGGINGIGAKIGNIHSTRFTVTTTDASQTPPLVYVQTFGDRLRRVDAPIIIRLEPGDARAAKLPAHLKTPHTSVRFSPHYRALGYTDGNTHTHLTPIEHQQIESWLRLRTHELAAYAGPKVVVTFNKIRCGTTDAAGLALLAAPHGDIISATVRPPVEPFRSHPWDIAMVVVPGNTRMTLISIVNGTRCTKGPHIEAIRRAVTEQVNAAVRRATKDKKKTVTPTEATRHLHLVTVGAVPNAKWGAQNKDELQGRITDFVHHVPGVTALKRIGNALAALVLAGRGDRTGRTKRPAHIDAFTAARRAGPGGRKTDWRRCTLLVGEGLSALGFLRAGLGGNARAARAARANTPTTAPTFETYGMFSLGGVPMNAMKNVTVTPRPGGQSVVPSEKLKNNKTFQNLVAVLGLDYSKQYNTAEERATLYYGGVTACVDQDLDGMGKILPLFLVFFQVFWPNLLAAGYIRRMVTPVIRVYPATGKKTASRIIAEFLYEDDARAWMMSDPRAASCELRFFKGLAAHKADELALMFQAESFARIVQVFRYSDAMANMFRAFYGHDSDRRKRILTAPMLARNPARVRAIEDSRSLGCDDQLAYEANLYKRDAIKRQMPCVTDGLKPTSRKVVMGAIMHLTSPRKVFQFGGVVASDLNYHHGDMSLNATIVGNAQRYPGGQGRRFPVLVGEGQFGTRHQGGGDAGSPRYISVRLARPWVNAVFPPADRFVYEYVFEDGKRAEPVHMPAVLPLAILESHKLPSEGWKHDSWARRFEDVVDLVRWLIGDRPGVPRIVEIAERLVAGSGDRDALEASLTEVQRLEAKLKLGVTDWKVQEQPRVRRGVVTAYGAHTVDDSGTVTVVTVTDLPIGLTTSKFVKDLEIPAVTRGGKSVENPKRALISSIIDESGGDDVHVTVTLKPGALVTITEMYKTGEDDPTTPMENFLGIKTALHTHMNLFVPGNRLVSFGSSYLAPVLYWYPFRRDLYGKRLRREETILRLRIRLGVEILRYVREDAERLDLAHTPSEIEASAALSGCAPPYPQLDHVVIRTPGYLTPDELIQRATEGSGISHDYLLNLRQRDLVIAAAARQQADVEKMGARLVVVRASLALTPPGIDMWRTEFEAAVVAAELGESTNWTFE